jgi:ferredoxin
MKKILLLLPLLAIVAAGAAWTLTYYKINPAQCNACGNCYPHCAYGAIYFSTSTYKYQIDSTLCTGDGLCVPYCPHNAIYLVNSGVAGSTETGAAPARKLSLRVAPNPARSGTAIILNAVSDGKPVEVRVYDVRGRLVRQLSSIAAACGPHTVRWDGRDGAGRPVASGRYLVRATVDGRSLFQPLSVVK